jgi:putative ABC transport system permease protein
MILAFWDTLRGAGRSLGTHKMRSVLTLLGIVIGVVAVVAMASTTEGLRRKIHQDLAMLGNGVFQVQKWPFGPHGGDRRKYEKRKNLTLAHVHLLQDHCTRCLRVAGESWSFGQGVQSGTRRTGTGAQVAGGTAGFFENNGFGLSRGRYFDEAEAHAGAPVAVIGADVVDVLFPHDDPIGRFIRIGGSQFRVIGTIERRGRGVDGNSNDNLVVVPIMRHLEIYGAHQSLNVTIQVRDATQMERTQDEVVGLLRKARGVPPQEENDFEMFSNESAQEEFETIASSIAAGSIGICAIALLIGGIGVMNIMLVSVTERTSEIGLRRALGARRRRILAQFLVEAVALTSFGGAIGVVLGAGVAALVKVLVNLPTVVPAWAVLLSMIVSGGVGLLFGIYPAWRASRLDPVEAMRHE